MNVNRKKGGRSMKKILVSLFSFVLFVFPNITYANGRTGEGGWHMIDDMMGGGIYMWILLIVVIGVAIYLLMNRSNQQLFSKHEETPLDILQKRYAKGKITKEEYEQMKQDLGN
jgi:putative membrane protein